MGSSLGSKLYRNTVSRNEYLSKELSKWGHGYRCIGVIFYKLQYDHSLLITSYKYNHVKRSGISQIRIKRSVCN